MTPQTKTFGRQNSSAILETKINTGISDGTACSRLFSSILLVDVQTTLAGYKSTLSLFNAKKIIHPIVLLYSLSLEKKNTLFKMKPDNLNASFNNYYLVLITNQ